MSRSMKSMMAVVGIVVTLLGMVNPVKEEMTLDSEESFSVNVEARARREVNESVFAKDDVEDMTDKSIDVTPALNNVTMVDESTDDNVGQRQQNDTNAFPSGVRRNNANADDSQVLNSSDRENDANGINDTVDTSSKDDDDSSNVIGSEDDVSLSVNGSSLIPDSNSTSNDNVTIEDTTMDSPNNDSSADNVTSLPTSTSLPATTAPPFVYVDPREFLTDDLDASCPLRRRGVVKVADFPSSPSTISCASLPVTCFNCTYDYACAYGAKTTVTCTTNVDCRGEKTIEREMTCQYCFQTKFGEEHVCTLRNGPSSGDGVVGFQPVGCNVKKSPSSQSRFQSNCTVRPHVLCLGRRSFHKMLPCNWTSGYRWTTSLILSIFLGGFGADRFYLGQWREGIGKLFSFGGLGVWTVIDVILISIGYIGPQDGSLYIY